VASTFIAGTSRVQRSGGYKSAELGGASLVRSHHAFRDVRALASARADPEILLWRISARSTSMERSASGLRSSTPSGMFARWHPRERMATLR
jgi:hypothetical protein